MRDGIKLRPVLRVKKRVVCYRYEISTRSYTCLCIYILHMHLHLHVVCCVQIYVYTYLYITCKHVYVMCSGPSAIAHGPTAVYAICWITGYMSHRHIHRQQAAHGTRADARHKQQPQADPESSTSQLQPQEHVLKFSAFGRMSLDDLPCAARGLCPVLK